MTEEPLPNPVSQWLWFILIASLGILTIIWFVVNWQVSSDVKPGASPEGLTFPAKPGFEISGAQPGEQAAPAPDVAAPAAAAADVAAPLAAAPPAAAPATGAAPPAAAAPAAR